MQIDWVVVLLLVVFFGCLGLVAAIVGREVWWQVRAAVEGIREWRAQRRGYCPVCGLDGGRHYALHAETEPPLGGDDQGWESSADRGHSALAGDRSLKSGSLSLRRIGRTLVSVTADQATEDDEWAEELHRINGLGKMGDLTRPIHHLTHYEVEAVIRQLRVPDWLPEHRLAA